MELPFTNGLNNFFMQHEIPQVLIRYQNPLVPGKPFGLAELKEALYLMVDTAYGLNLPILIHRAGNRYVLLDRYIG